MDKPDVDSIEGLSPAISIEQKSTSKNPRSTVGTVTEIYDYLRLLYARIGVHHCPKCGSSIRPQSPENITSLVMSEKGRTLTFLAPVIRGMKGNHEQMLENLKKQGYTRIRIDQKVYDSDLIKDVKLARYEKHWIEAVIDTVKIDENDRSRVSEAVEQALQFGKGTMIVIDSETAPKRRELDRFTGETMYSTFGACPNHPEMVFENLEPRMFSFNSPFGACPTCHGLGEILEISEDLVIPDRSKSIMDGALAIYGKMDLSWRAQQLGTVGKKHGFDLFTPIEKLSKKQVNILLYGSTDPIKGNWSNGASMQMNRGWEGIIPQTMRLYRQTESDFRRRTWRGSCVSGPASLARERGSRMSFSPSLSRTRA
jgi:excinuclease ABC subunit A